MTMRTGRKSFIKRNGIDNYKFDYVKEINKYRFLCGEKISRKQWKALHNKDKIYTYDEWKASIRNKYESCTFEELSEFSRYLNHCQRRVTPIKELLSILISSLFAMVFTFFIEELLKMMNPEQSKVGMFLRCIIVVVVLLCIIGSILNLVINGMELFSDNNIRSNFYVYFNEIVDELIK